MRPLTPAMSAAINAHGAQPTLQVTGQDLQRRTGVTPVTARPYARSKLLVTGAGTLLIPQIAPLSGPQSLLMLRITDPTQAAQWQVAAPPVVTPSALGMAGVAIVQSGTVVRVFYVNAASNALCYRDSTDDGVTWGAEVTAAAQPFSGAVCTGIAARSTTDVYSAWYQYAPGASYLYRTQYSGGWSAYSSVGPAAGSAPWGQLRGIDLAVNPGGLVCLVAGVQLRAQRSGIAAASATFNGGAWSLWATIQPMDTAVNGLGYANPTVLYNATDGLFYATIQLQDSGAVSGTVQNRVLTSVSSDGLNWSAFATAGNLFQNEVHYLPLGAPPTGYIFDAATTVNAPPPAAGADLSTDILSLTIEEAEGVPARFTIRVANDQGQYTANGQLRDNATVAVSLGYNGTVIATHTCLIDAVEYRAGPEVSDLVIHGRDIRKGLDQICTTFTPLAQQTVAQIATTICRLANVPLLALPTTPQFNQVLPCFMLLPGESWSVALRRLAGVYGFDILCATPAAVKIVERSATDASSWSYGSEHLGLVWQEAADGPNVVRVVGASTGASNVFAEAVDTANVQSSGTHRYQHVIDRLCTTAAQCLLKAQLVLRDDGTQRQTGALTCTVNPQLEVGDVITLTEMRVGLSSERARINRLTTTIDWGSGAWSQTLGLELP